MPDRQSYDEAMLFARARLKVSDPELKQGQVETYTLNTTLGSYERPWGIEGGFAVVYKFRTQSGRLRALRCFRVPMSEDTQARYEQIGPYFQQHAPTITAGFLYHKDAIQIKEQGKPQPQTFPVIEMDWIEGDTLVDRVNTLCQQQNSAALARLSQEWLSILQTMQRARIAHGDLAGVNVMVHDDATLVLIDYDGVYIPPLDGLPQTLLGQADYQHPEVVQRKFDEHMDNFSALVIYTALSALSVQPTLWQRYSKHNTAGKLEDTNLLFTQDDFKHPQQSALLRELASMKDERVKALARALIGASQEPVGRVRFPHDLIDAAYLSRQALERLEQAIRADDDEAIVAAWVPALDQNGSARKYQERRRLAQRRVQALARLRTALRQGNLQQITAAYDPSLDESTLLGEHERTRIHLAHQLLQGIRDDDDEKLVALANEISGQDLFDFTQPEEERLALAQQRHATSASLRRTLAQPASSAEEIADAHTEAMLHTDIRIDAKQQELVNAARSYLVMRSMLQRALQEGDDELVARIYNAELAKRFEGFSDAEQRAINHVLLSRRLEDLLQQEQYRHAIDMAQYIQKTTGRELSDGLKFKLRTAIMRFVRQQNLTQLIVSIKKQASGNHAFAQWRWPQDTLVQDGMLVWSPVAWPLRPQEQHMLRPDSWHIVVRRRSDQAQGTCEFPIGPATHIYVQAFAAIADYWDRNRTWRFSDGTDATSYAETAAIP